jgi:hypothetical protein
MLLLYAEKETIAAKLLGAKGFVGIGLISYSAYLWHQPLFAFARIRSVEHPSLLLMSLLSLTSLVLAYFSWRFIEKPFRQPQIVARKFVFIVSFLGIFAFIVMGSSGHFTNGFKAIILNEGQIAKIDTLERSSLPDCSRRTEECFRQLEPSEGREIVLLGDSNAYHFSVGLQRIADDFDYSLHTLTFPGCMPLAEFYRLDQSLGFNSKCISFNRLVNDKLSESDEKFDVIIVSAAWLLYFYGDEILSGLDNYSGTPKIGGTVLSLDGNYPISVYERKEIFLDYFNNLLSQLSLNANAVVVVGPLPPSIVRFDNKFSLRNLKLISTDQYLTSISEFLHIFNNSTSSFQVSVIDLTSQLCDENECQVIRNNNFLYGDPTHLSHYGQSTIIAPMLEELLRERGLHE